MIAAASMEFPGIVAHAGGVSHAGLAVDWSRSARLGEHDLLLAANGAGAHRAALRLARLYQVRLCHRGACFCSIVAAAQVAAVAFTALYLGASP